MRRTQKYGQPHITAMFDMHNLNIALPSEKQSATLCEVFHIPVIGTREYPWLRTSEIYPREEVIEKLGADLFSDVICYMLALAIHKEFERIDLWGVHLHSNHCDHQESAIVHYWLGRAHGAGITIIVNDYDHPECSILSNSVYWTGPGSYGHWDEKQWLADEATARTEPLKLPDGMRPKKMPLQEVARPGVTK